MEFSRSVTAFLPGLLICGFLAVAACHRVPAPKPESGVVQKPSATDVIQEQRRFDDRGGRGGGF